MTQLPTPFYETDRVTLYCGDCREIMPSLKSVGAVISDPPYGIKLQMGKKSPGCTGLKGTRNLKMVKGDDEPFDPSHVLAFSKDMTIALMGGDHYAQRLPPGRFYTWDKAVGCAAATTFVDAEYIWSNRRNARNIFHFLWMGALREGQGYSSPSTKRVHVSQKPVELMIWIMQTVRVSIRATVLDPYMGSGSTGVACLQTGRKFIGIEIDPEHCAIAAERLAQAEAAITPTEVKS